ncbi:DUF58 domain-containing protein [Butyrivibrio sp. VCB2006]|uniref:DUF58 domain-containing protein n=1 Tax=Butyrivibrio sp. VCB2006 TaxID=1280679 RepID=UPI0004928FD9|nr:DUF58 domain-containing protein [Butyrivibrio sp. VCB2006]
MKITVCKLRLIIYLIVLIASLVFASFYGGPVAFAWLYAVLLLIPVSILYIFINNSFLRIYQEIEVHRLTKGEEHRYRVSIDNEGILPIHRMKLYLYADRCELYEIENGQELSLDIHEKKELSSGINCKYAGTYNVGIESVSFTDPFGIYTITIDIQYSFRAIVSPRITDMADRVLDIENLFNNTGLKSPRIYENTPGSDNRPYQRGDSLSSINWKVSARLSELVSRIPDRMEKRTVTILLQAVNVPERDQDTEFLKKRDFFLEFAVSAAWHFGQQGMPLRIIYPSGKITESTVDSYESFLEFYNVVADSIFYSSDENYRELQSMALKAGESVYGQDTWIIIREDPKPGEDYYLICG